MKKVVFVNRFFFPDLSATSQMLTDLAIGLAEAGWNVQIITSRKSFDDPKVRLEANGMVSGVVIHRIWTTRFGRSSLLGRGVDYFSFYVCALWKMFRVLNKGDTLVIKTDPPLLGVPASLLCRLQKVDQINWLQDLFPEVAEGLGVGFGRGFVGRVLRRLRNWSLNSSKVNVVNGERMAVLLNEIGIPEHKVVKISNWADGSLIKPVLHEKNSLRKKWGLEGQFVIGYSGNMGRAHVFDMILEAAQELLEEDRITFLFVGGGAQFDSLREKVVARSLPNVVFKPYQPKVLLSETLGVPDVHLVCLNPDMEGLIVPSKFYGITAASRSSVFIGDPDGEIARIQSAHGIGFSVEEGDLETFVSRIKFLEAKPLSELDEMGRQSRKVFEKAFSLELGIKSWIETLEYHS